MGSQVHIRHAVIMRVYRRAVHPAGAKLAGVPPARPRHGKRFRKTEYFYELLRLCPYTVMVTMLMHRRSYMQVHGGGNPIG